MLSNYQTNAVLTRADLSLVTEEQGQFKMAGKIPLAYYQGASSTLCRSTNGLTAFVGWGHLDEHSFSPPRVLMATRHRGGWEVGRSVP